MERKNNKWNPVVWCGLLCFFLAPFPAVAADGLFTALTDDGVTLKLMRYRPDATASFRESGRPVLL